MEFLLSKDRNCKDVIVLLHGGPGLDSGYFFPYLNPLLDYFSIAHFQQGNENSKNIEDVVLEVKKVVDEVSQNSNVYLLGHSWGGALALEYVRRYPYEISGLILVSWVYDTEWHLYRDKLTVRRDTPDFASLESANERFSNLTRAVAELYFNNEVLDVGKKILDKINYNGDFWERFGSSYLYNELFSSDVVASLKIPTISITGANDLCVPVEYVRKGASMNPSILSVEIPGADHFPFVQFPNEFNSFVINFIKERNI